MENMTPLTKIYFFCHTFYGVMYYIFLPLLFLAAAVLLYYAVRQKKLFFILLFILPFSWEVIHTSVIYGAWRYRMELRDSYGKNQWGWTDISVMVPDKKAEYAKYSYHPRERNVKGGLVRLLVLLPLLYLAGSIFYASISFFKYFFRKYVCKKQ